jgi:hypothetical protein
MLKTRQQQKCTPKSEESRLTQQLLQVLLQGLILGLAGTILRQQLLEDVGLKLVTALRIQRSDFQRESVPSQLPLQLPQNLGASRRRNQS